MSACWRWLLLLAGFGVFASVSAAPVSFTDLARHLRCEAVKISPDGRYIALTAVVHGRTVLAVLRLADMHGFNLETHDNGDVIDFAWVSPTRVVYTEGIRDSDFDAPLADGQLFAVNADGSGRDLLYGYGSHNPYYGPADLIAALPDDPGNMLVSITDEDTARSDGALTWVGKMSVTSGRMIKLMSAPADDLAFIVDHAGNVRFAYGVDNDDHVVLYSRAVAGSSWTPMPEAAAARDVPLGFEAGDRFAWFTCTVPVGFGICKWDPASRRMTPMWTNSRVTATGLAAGPVKDAWLGVDFDNGRPGVALFDAQSAGAKLLVSLMQQFPGESVRFVSSTRDGSRAIVAVSADTDPGTFYLYDRATRKLSPLLRVAPWIDPQALASRQPFEFVARDGLKLQGYVSYPPGLEGAKKLPMVVYVHGGPYGVRDWWDYDPAVQALATRGYAVLQVNYRGSGGYGHDFEKAGWMQWGAAMQDDVTDATRWAIAQGIADPTRICIYGASYGGYAALEGAVREPGLYKCAIGYVGVYDLALMQKRGDIPQTTYGKNYLARVIGHDKLELAQRSPVDNVDRIKARVMLIVGGEDARVPPIQGQNMRSALRDHGIPVEWIYQRKEGHGFYNEANVAELYQKIDAFVAATIGPGAAPAPAK